MKNFNQFNESNKVKNFFFPKKNKNVIPSEEISKSESDGKDFSSYVGEDYKSFIEGFLDHSYNNQKDYNNDNPNLYINSYKWHLWSEGYFNRLVAGYEMPGDKKKDTSKFSKINSLSIQDNGRIKVTNTWKSFSGYREWVIFGNENWITSLFEKYSDVFDHDFDPDFGRG